jgi:hypothetical protein
MVEYPSKPIVSSIAPTDVLYYYDEPLIFFSETSGIPLLCLKIDEESNGNIFLAVVASHNVITQLRDGSMSLRAAFSQSWCWIIRASKDYSVQGSEGLAREAVPDQFLPEPGVGLYPHHGTIADQFFREKAPSNFLSVSFKGGELSTNTMSFGVFKGLIDGVYSAVRKIFGPVIENISGEPMSEVLIGRLLNVPIHPPAFASLTITINRPEIDTSTVKKRVSLDKEKIEQSFGGAADTFVSDVTEIEKLAREDKIHDRFAYGATVSLEIMAHISPSESTPFESIEIGGDFGTNNPRKILIGVKEGQKIVDAYNQINQRHDEIYGSIIDFNIKSSTFVIMQPDGYEVTCLVGGRELEAAIPAFTHGTKIKVVGKLTKRIRRDYMRVEKVELPDGTIISRNDNKN